jgi:hypothetical protein
LPARSIQQQSEQTALNAYDNTTRANHVKFLHVMCGSPVPATWIQAIDNGHFLLWPGLTTDLVRNHLPKSPATVKGHQHQQRKNVRSTKAKIPSGTTEDDLKPTLNTPNLHLHHIFSSIIEVRQEIATDLTGPFPIQSSRGHKYILILYDFDLNAILAKPLQNCSELEHIHAYKNCMPIYWNVGSNHNSSA